MMRLDPNRPWAVEQPVALPADRWRRRHGTPGEGAMDCRGGEKGSVAEARRGEGWGSAVESRGRGRRSRASGSCAKAESGEALLAVREEIAQLTIAGE
ncbi:hypothetical protein E2562_013928 [Oryza meyeriana var. granulata]|uniref:Uncharacterized protein n=1 Tax=Oryza meyeriana var. granulata TaxID=110450 RepID=A0A6G1C629_9ORYZ|nr:hypothetical protein E2562_013928 [Oryza meyeriana var. granulata]